MDLQPVRERRMNIFHFVTIKALMINFSSFFICLYVRKEYAEDCIEDYSECDQRNIEALLMLQATPLTQQRPMHNYALQVLDATYQNTLSSHVLCNSSMPYSSTLSSV